MIVERRTHKTKPFCEQETADLCKEIWTVFGASNVVRIYRHISGPENVVYQEFEFRDWQEREQYWAGVYARPEMPEWSERWKELTESGGNIEFLGLVE